MTEQNQQRGGDGVSDDIIHEIKMYTRLSAVFEGCLNELLQKTGYKLTMSLPDKDELTTYRLEPLCQPPRCDPKCDHESGSHEASPPAPPPTTQMLVLYCGRVLVIESPEVMMVESLRFVVNDSVPKLINLPPGSVVKEIK